jgi:hypothetical protein
VYAKDLDWHDWPIFRPRNMGDTETRPTDDVGIADILVAVDPFLKTEILSTWILVDMNIRGEELLLVVWSDKHLIGD